MKEISLTMEQKKAAENLNEGKVIYSYLDGKNIRMETEEGDDPFVWRVDRWKRMTYNV